MCTQENGWEEGVEVGAHVKEHGPVRPLAAHRSRVEWHIVFALPQSVVDAEITRTG